MFGEGAEHRTRGACAPHASATQGEMVIMRSEANVPARNRAVFLDRDGVLIEDVGLLTAAGQIRILEGAPLALRRCKEAGFHLLVVSNQTVIARGLATEAEVEKINAALNQRLIQAGAAARLSGFMSARIIPTRPWPPTARIASAANHGPGCFLAGWPITRWIPARASPSGTG